MIRRLLLVFLLTGIFPCASHAFWIWTPETGQWTNPKYSVKDTPAEQLGIVTSHFEAADYVKTIAEAKKLIKHYPRAKEAAEAQYFTGRAFEAQNKIGESFKAYQLVIDKYPYSDRANEIIERQFNMANSLLEGKTNRSKWVAVMGDNFQIVEIFRQVIKNAPYGKYAPVAQYKIGLYLKEKELLQEARDEFEKTMNDYPDSESAKAAKYQIAMVDAKRSSDVQRDQKVTQIAVNEFEEYVQSHPDSDLSEDAKNQIKVLKEKDAQNNFVVAEFYEKQKNAKAAKIYYATIVDDFADSAWAEKAAARLQALGGR